LEEHPDASAFVLMQYWFPEFSPQEEMSLQSSPFAQEEVCETFRARLKRSPDDPSGDSVSAAKADTLLNTTRPKSSAIVILTIFVILPPFFLEIIHRCELNLYFV